MPPGIFRQFFRQQQHEPLGVKLAELQRLRAAMQQSGFGGSQISRNWRDLVDAEHRLRTEMAERHLAAIQLAEDGDYDAAIARHRANYEDRFHVADTYEVLAMDEQRQGNLEAAIAIMETGCQVFRELVDPTAPHRERALGFMERRLERLRSRLAAGGCAMNRERATATLLNYGATARLATVYIELIDRTDPQTGVAHDWSGYFQIAAGEEPEWDVHAFTLELQDGRRGRIMVTYRQLVAGGVRLQGPRPPGTSMRARRVLCVAVEDRAHWDEIQAATHAIVQLSTCAPTPLRSKVAYRRGGAAV